MPIMPGQRAQILSHVSAMLPRAERERGDYVTLAAAPVLEWASGAYGYTDSELRMKAMSRARYNLDAAASAADRKPGGSPVLLSPARLLEETLIYYAFIAGAAASA